jgi:hypothetical protein
LGGAVGYSALPIVAVLLLDASDFQVSLLTVPSSVVSATLVLPRDAAPGALTAIPRRS